MGQRKKEANEEDGSNQNVYKNYFHNKNMKAIINTPEKLVLRIETNNSLANALRRSILEISTLAIEEVEIFKNDSALYDEILSHRLGLIPIKTEKGMSEKTKVEFKLSKKGPCTVYAEDLDGSAEIVYPKIPITILGDNHKLELVATAVLGKGISHAKNTPGLCYYRSILEIKSSPKIDEIIEKSKGWIKPEKEDSKWLCDLTEAEVDEILKIDKNAVSDSSESLLIIESFGQMPAKDILIKSSQVMESNLEEVEKEIK